MKKPDFPFRAEDSHVTGVPGRAGAQELRAWDSDLHGGSPRATGWGGTHFPSPGTLPFCIWVGLYSFEEFSAVALPKRQRQVPSGRGALLPARGGRPRGLGRGNSSPGHSGLPSNATAPARRRDPARLLPRSTTDRAMDSLPSKTNEKRRMDFSEESSPPEAPDYLFF